MKNKNVPPEAPPPPFMLDGRLLLLLLIAACFVCQYIPAGLLPAWLLLLACLFIPKKMRNDATRRMLRGGAFFVLFWFAMVALSDLTAGKGWRESAAAALPLGARLFALTLVGTAYAGYVSPVTTGKAAARFLRPLLGRPAWRPALAIALTAWFLPQALRLSSDVRLAMRARGLALPWRRRALLVVGTSLRILEAKADELAVGLASRYLDDERTWR